MSVVIATHNRPELLRTALDAVLAQDYPGSIECLVVFDRAEPDATLELRDAARVVRVMRNERTPGLAGGRNTGILSATGKYVAFCDDDDIWLPSKLAKQVPLLEGAPERVAVCGITVCYDGSETDRIPRRSELELANLIRHRVTAAHPSSVIVERQHLLDQIGLVDEQIPGSYGEDFDWLIRAASAGSISVVEEPLVRVLWGQSQFSQNWATIVEAIDYGLQKHAMFHSDSQALARLHGRRAFALAALGRRREALAASWSTVRLHRREQRAYLAAAVALRVVSAKRLMHVAHRRGHGI